MHERLPCAQGAEPREHRELPETALVAVSVLVESLHSRAATQVEQERAKQEKAEQGKRSRDTRRQHLPASGKWRDGSRSMDKRDQARSHARHEPSSLPVQDIVQEIYALIG